MDKLHPHLPYIAAEVVWGIRYEMARTVEDILARRVRALFLDARAAIDMAPAVAAIMAVELNKDTAWKKEQIDTFTLLAQAYLLQPYFPAG
jgi:glycerol-3-phosphate dehydrogenase